MSVLVVVEGDTDLPVARKLARDARLSVANEIDCGGKDRLDRSLAAYNDAAKGSPWLVLRDLDHDADCAPSLLGKRRFRAARWMCFRIAVRETEAWLLADATGLAAYLEVDEPIIPNDPDLLEDPTAALLDVASKSPRRAMRNAMLPAPGAFATVGPLYEATIIDFGLRHWSLNRACRRSESLRRARAALRALGRRWRDSARGIR